MCDKKKPVDVASARVEYEEQRPSQLVKTLDSLLNKVADVAVDVEECLTELSNRIKSVFLKTI